MLKNMNIGTRLLLLLVSLLLLMIVIGGVGVYALNDSNTSAKSLYDNNLMATADLSKLMRLNLRIRIDIADAIIDPDHMADDVSKVNESLALSDKIWNTYMQSHLQDEAKILAGKVGETRTKFVEDGINPILALMKANNPNAIKKEMNATFALFEPYRTAMNELIDFEARDAMAANVAHDATYQTVRMASIVLVLVGTIFGGVLGMSIIRGINRSVGDLRGTMVRMATDGDLSQRSKIHGSDEIGQAAKAFNGLMDGFAAIISKVIGGAETVSSTAAQLATSSLQISRGSQAQSEAAASTAAAVEEITVSINSVAANTQDVRKLSEQSLSQTKQGNESVVAMVGEIERVQVAVTQIAGSVKEFVESTRAIAGMTQQVKDIADQTNLLALNAAIEAARAGEQGRGFAVVADEVRKLAEKSARSASEIDQVTNSLNKKSASVEAVVQTGLSSLQATQEQVVRVSAILTEAGDAVSKSSHGVSDIAASVSEQSLASTEIARNVEKIAQMSEENHAALESNSKDIVLLEKLAKELQGAVSRFRV